MIRAITWDTLAASPQAPYPQLELEVRCWVPQALTQLPERSAAEVTRRVLLLPTEYMQNLPTYQLMLVYIVLLRR